MGRPLRVISIDGTRGAGKTSQIAMLSRHLKSIGMVVSTLKMADGEDPIQSGLVSIAFCESFLAKGDNHAVILDGSVARPMVVDIMTGMPNTVLLEKYKLLMQAYERLEHKYGIASILMVMDDMEECNRRIKKFKQLTGQGNDEFLDLNQEHDVVSGMRFFNSHIASKNINFQVLDLLPYQSMIDINKLVLATLSQKYEFQLPQRNSEDW